MKLALPALFLLAVSVHAQTYDYQLTQDPAVCFSGCAPVSSTGQFTVAGSTITSLTGTLTVDQYTSPITLYTANGGNLFGSTANPIASNLWLEPTNIQTLVELVPGPNGLAMFKSPTQQPLSGPLNWYAPVVFKVILPSTLPLPAPTPAQLTSYAHSQAARNVGLAIGLPAAGAVVYLIVRHEIRAHQHRDALPSGKVAF